MLWGEPQAVLADLVRSWRPDLVVARAGDLPRGVLDGVDVLTVRTRGGLLARVSAAFEQWVPHHA